MQTEIDCPNCGLPFVVDEVLTSDPFQCPHCAASLTDVTKPRKPRLLANLRSKPGPALLLAGACLFLIVLIASGLLSPMRAGKTPGTGVRGNADPNPPPTPVWIHINYRDLLPPDAIIRTGQTLAQGLRDPDLRNAVQPFVDHFSSLLPAALEMTSGQDAVPFHDVVDFFPVGTGQPAWVGILRGGRIHIATNDQDRVKVFLLGDNPEQAYRENYSVIRHCLKMLLGHAGGDLMVEVFSYHHDYATSELNLNISPYLLHCASFETDKTFLNLDALAEFLARGPTLRAGALSKKVGLSLYGSEGAPPTLSNQPLDLSDLAAAYRAVFHAGDNSAFISLDPHKDPTKCTVNFGGFLENTRIGSVVLEADKRFKTITSGLDPNSFKDLRAKIRQKMPSFLSGAERDLLEAKTTRTGEWIGTRFWYYPDSIAVDADLDNQYAIIVSPRFTADAERSKDDFLSLQDFERKKRLTLSPSIRANIDDLNVNYQRYAATFTELSELEIVGRLMAICSWLSKAKPEWLDLDQLLAVQLPPCKTDEESTQLIAATVVSSSRETPSREDVVQNANLVFLTPILNQGIGDYFHSAPNLARYLSGKTNPSAADLKSVQQDAVELFNSNRDMRVRDLLISKRDVRRFADYAANNIESPESRAKEALEVQIDSFQSLLNTLDAKIEAAKKRMSNATSREDYNGWVDQHNKLVEEYERNQQNFNQLVVRYNALNAHVSRIIEIGGGISLEPSKIKVRKSTSSDALNGFKSTVNRIGTNWSDVGTHEKWISSSATTETRQKNSIENSKLTMPSELRSDLVKSWVKKDSSDGSWKSAVKLEDGRFVEKVYDAKKGQLQAAEFTNGTLSGMVVGHKDSNGKIVFTRSDRRSVLVPSDPPRWHSEN